MEVLHMRDRPAIQNGCMVTQSCLSMLELVHVVVSRDTLIDV